MSTSLIEQIAERFPSLPQSPLEDLFEHLTTCSQGCMGTIMKLGFAHLSLPAVESKRAVEESSGAIMDSLCSDGRELVHKLLIEAMPKGKILGSEVNKFRLGQDRDAIRRAETLEWMREVDESEPGAVATGQTNEKGEN